MADDWLFPMSAEDRTIQERFEEFDAANPQIYRLFSRFAVAALESGRKRYSADAILHRIRWFVDIETQGDESFKLNNNFSSRYARKLAAEDERFQTFFEFRVLKTS